MMNRYPLLLVISFLSLLWVGCASRRQPAVTEEQTIQAEPSPQALDHFLRGVIYDQQGELTRAIAEYRRALKFDSTSGSIYQALAEDYLALRLPDDAISLLYTALKYDSLDVEVLQFLSDVLVQVGRLDSAASLLDRLVRNHPDEPSYHLNLANVHLRANRVPEAIEQYREALELQPANREALGKLSTLLISQGDYQNALDAAIRLYELSPNDDRVCFTVASLLAELNRSAEADSFFAEAAELNPDDPRYFTNWAYMHMNNREYDRAVEILQKGTYYHATAPNIWALLGSAYQLSDQDSLALEALDVSLELDASQIGAYITLGFIYDERGDWDKAIEVYDQALTISPDDALLLNNYAYLLAQKGTRLEDAMSMVQKALEKSPDNPSYLDTYGWIYFVMGDYSKAMEYIQRALELNPENPDILDHIGDIYEKMGDYAKARDAWIKALEFDPENIPIREKLAR